MSSRRRRVNTSLIIDLLWRALIDRCGCVRRHRTAYLSVRVPSARREDHDWDPARTRAPLVYVVAGVVVVDQAPELLALGALGLVRAHRDQPAVDHDVDVGVGR